MPRSIANVAAALAALSVAAPAAWSKPLSDADRIFITSDVQGARYELALAQQAQQASMRPDVKAYASRVAADHQGYNEELERLALAQKVVVPPGLAPEDKARLDKMSGQSGTEYDRAFIAEAVRVNAQDVKDSAAEASSTQAPEIKSFLAKFESMDQQHEAGAKALQK